MQLGKSSSVSYLGVGGEREGVGEGADGEGSFEGSAGVTATGVKERSPKSA